MGAWGFSAISVVSVSVSGRAGSTDVGTISGFSCATETGWNSGLAEPKFRNGFEVDISTSTGRETTSGFRRISPPAYAT